MRNLIGLGMMLCNCVACTTSVASQPDAADLLNDTTTTSVVSPTCRMVSGTADVDGATQNISGLACKQPDGTWQIQQQAAFTEGAAFMGAAGGTVSPWSHTRGSPPYARAG